MHAFAETYKSYPNWRLLEILNNQEDYKLEAVEAAQHELTSRHLDEAALNEAEAEYLSHNPTALPKVGKDDEGLDDDQHLIGDENDNPNSLLKSIQSGQKQLRIIAILFGLFSAFVLIKQLKFLKLMFETELDYNVNTIIFLSSTVLLPVASFLFGLRKKLGWFIWCFYIVRYIINMIKVSITFMPANSPVDAPAYFNFSFLIGVGIILVAFWSINKKSVFQLFNIKKQTRTAFIAVIVILSWLMGW